MSSSLQDFEAWFKWLLFDALKTAALRLLVHAFPPAQSVLAFLGLI